jgi:hypothetical protein
LAKVSGSTGVIILSDLTFEDFEISVDSSGSDLVAPPKMLLGVTAGLLVLSVLCIFLDNALGYGLTVVASIMGGVVVFADQKKKASPNYVSIGWFSPGLRIIRFAVTAVALVNIVLLAIESAR